MTLAEAVRQIESWFNTATGPSGGWNFPRMTRPQNVKAWVLETLSHVGEAAPPGAREATNNLVKRLITARERIEAMRDDAHRRYLGTNSGMKKAAAVERRTLSAVLALLSAAPPEGRYDSRCVHELGICHDGEPEAAPPEPRRPPERIHCRQCDDEWTTALAGNVEERCPSCGWLGWRPAAPPGAREALTNLARLEGEIRASISTVAGESTWQVLAKKWADGLAALSRSLAGGER